MEKLIGIKWGMLQEKTQQWLLEGANYIDGVTGNDVSEGKCIVDLTDELSVSGSIFNDELIIDDEAIIYNPSEGISEAKENIEFDINKIMTVNEAAEMWGITEGAIRAAIKARKFVLGVDYRKAGRITLITKDAMNDMYGELDI